MMLLVLTQTRGYLPLSRKGGCKKLDL